MGSTKTFVALAVVGVTLFTAGVAQAGFRAQPPSSMTLMGSPGAQRVETARYRLLFAQDAQDEGFSPPPLLSVPGGDVVTPPPPPPPESHEPARTTPPPPYRESPPRVVDRVPPLREVSPARRVAEVIVGSGAVLALDVVAVGTIFIGALFAAVGTLGGSASALQTVGIVLIAVGALEELILPPLVAALGVSITADPLEEGGFGRAVLAGYIVHGVTILVGVIIGAVLANSGGVNLNQLGTATPYSIASTVISIVHLVGIPIAASFGYHARSEAPRPTALLPRPSERQQLRERVTPTDQALAERRAVVAAPIAAFAF